MKFKLRAATLEERPAIRALIERSARGLGVQDYRAEQVEGALKAAFGVDSQLISDGTYFVAELAGNPGAGLVGCGGWSRRRTLFGGDARADRDAGLLDPATDAAKIRAFFIDPAYARRGLGTLILAHCEDEAKAAGFRRFEMMATLPGIKLYAQRGYAAGEKIDYPVGEGVTLELIPMSKSA